MSNKTNAQNNNAQTSSQNESVDAKDLAQIAENIAEAKTKEEVIVAVKDALASMEKAGLSKEALGAVVDGFIIENKDSFKTEGEFDETIKSLKELGFEVSVKFEDLANKAAEALEGALPDLDGENKSLINFRNATIGGAILGAGLATLHKGLNITTGIGAAVGVGAAWFASSETQEKEVREKFEGSESVLFTGAAIGGALMGSGGVYIAHGVKTIANKLLGDKAVVIEGESVTVQDNASAVEFL